MATFQDSILVLEATLLNLEQVKEKQKVILELIQQAQAGGGGNISQEQLDHLYKLSTEVQQGVKDVEAMQDEALTPPHVEHHGK